MDHGGIIIERATLADIIDLRHAILRAGLPRETAIFPGDEAATSRHYAARIADGRVVGCATFHLNEWQGESAWQLRGMATSEDFRGQGLGRRLLQFAEREILTDVEANAACGLADPADRLIREAASGLLPRLLWCNARVPAKGFYERMGWTTVSDVFEIPTAGPHVKMVRRLVR